jgi:hypothetical protein
MSAGPAPSGTAGQFLIAGSPPVLARLLDLLTADPDTQVVSGARSPQGELRRLVVTMTAERASALTAAFGDDVQVEPDDVLPNP